MPISVLGELSDLDIRLDLHHLAQIFAIQRAWDAGTGHGKKGKPHRTAKRPEGRHRRNTNTSLTSEAFAAAKSEAGEASALQPYVDELRGSSGNGSDDDAVVPLHFIWVLGNANFHVRHPKLTEKLTESEHPQENQMQWSRVRLEYRNFSKADQEAREKERRRRQSEGETFSVQRVTPARVLGSAMYNIAVNDIILTDNGCNPILGLEANLMQMHKPACAIFQFVSKQDGKTVARLDVNSYHVELTTQDTRNMLREKEIKLLKLDGECGSFTMVHNKAPKSRSSPRSCTQ